MKLRQAKKIWVHPSGWLPWLKEKYSPSQINKSSKVYLNHIERKVRNDNKKTNLGGSNNYVDSIYGGNSDQA